MNIFKRFFSGSTNNQKSSFSRSDGVYIVDATGLINQRYRTGTGHGSPRDHATILKDMTEFATKEDIKMIVLFTGRPLREAAAGSEQKGVLVDYAENRDALKQKMFSLARKNKSKKNIVILTADSQLESEARNSRFNCMRLATFKKAISDNEIKERKPIRKNDSQRTGNGKPERDNKISSSETRDAAVLTLIDPI